MSLLELLIGSTVFAAAAGASLQLWALAGAAAVAEERQQQRMEQAEAALLRAETALRRLAPGGVDCSTATTQVLQLLAADPLAPGLVRQLEPSATGDGVVLRLTVEGEATPRQRLFVPAVLGLCGPALQGGSGGNP
jgi:type II secretory pathway pseudopilin PulG